MKKQKLLTLVLSFSMIFAAGTSAFADEQTTPVFADMPDNWSTVALQNAVSNGLLNGYEENGTKLIKPDGKLTRAEMAAIMNNAFNATEKADMTGVLDVAENQWYTDHMAASVQMEGLSKAAKMRPTDNITREEAFTVLAKVFKLEASQDYTKLDTYTDTDKISTYAKDRIAALLNEGYISGDNNRIKPLENITRAEFAAMMNNIVSQYITTEGEVTEVVTGNVLVNTAEVTLKDVTIDGNLILADGIGSGEVTLDGVTVTGEVIVRSGVVTVTADTVVEKVNLAAEGTVIQGQGIVKNAKINGNNSQVNTNNTEITVAEDVTGASSGSTMLESGSTHTSDADASEQTPPVDTQDPDEEDVTGEDADNEDPIEEENPEDQEDNLAR